MKKNYDYGSKSISSWGYVWFNVLYAIPVIGWLVWLINAIGAKNRNVKNHARSYFCAVVLGLIVAVIVAIAVALVIWLAPDVVSQVLDLVQSYTGIDVRAYFGMQS